MGSGTASVAGIVRTSVLNTPNILPGDHTVTILSAGGGATHAGLSLVAPISAIATFSLRYPDAQTIQLGYLVDFAPSGLNHNQSSVGGYFNGVQTAGGTPAMGPVISALFGVPTVAGLANVYDHITQEPYVQQITSTHQASLNFTDRLFSCAAPGGQFQVGDEESCGWMRMDVNRFQRTQTTQNQAFRETTVAVSGGVEKGLEGGWRIGAALAYENSSSLFAHADSSGDRVQGGVVAKKDAGWAELALAVTGGRGEFTVNRKLDLPSNGLQAQGQQSITFGTVSARIARKIGAPGAWVRPGLEVVGTVAQSDNVVEKNGGPLNLNVAARQQNYWLVRPSIEVGGDFKVKDHIWLRPTARFTLNQVLAGRGTVLDATMEGGPGGVGPFRIRSTADRTTEEVSAGVSLVDSRGISARLGYVRQFGDSTREEGGQLKVVVPF